MRTPAGGDLEERPVCVPSAKPDNGFLPPINVKSTPSPLSEASSAGESEVSPHQKQTTFRGNQDRRRASILMDLGNDQSTTTSRLSSHVSSSTSSSPTKLPFIDRHNTNSVSSLSSTRSLRHTNALLNGHFGLFGQPDSSRSDICRSPSCPQLLWSENEDLDGAMIHNGDLGASIHPHMIRTLNGGPSLKLPDIFSECSTSTTPRVNGYSNARKSTMSLHNALLDASDVQQSDGHTPRLDALSTSNMVAQSKRDVFQTDDCEKQKKKKRASKRTKNKKDENNKITKLSSDYNTAKMDTFVRHSNSQSKLSADESENVDVSYTKASSQIINGENNFGAWEANEDSQGCLKPTDHKSPSSVLLFDDSGAIDQIARENGVLGTSCQPSN